MAFWDGAEALAPEDSKKEVNPLCHGNLVILEKRVRGDGESPLAGFAPITLYTIRSDAASLKLKTATPSTFVYSDGIQELRLIWFLESRMLDLIEIADAVINEFLIAFRICLIGSRSLFPWFCSVCTVGHVEVPASPRRRYRDFHISCIAARKYSSIFLAWDHWSSNAVQRSTFIRSVFYP
jgi:hypothetical protein